MAWMVLSRLHQLDIKKSANFKGYTALLQENTNPEGLGDLHEGFDIGWEPELPPPATPSERCEPANHHMTGSNVWPTGPPGFKEAVLTY